MTTPDERHSQRISSPFEARWERIREPFTLAMTPHRLSSDALFNLGATAIGLATWLQQKTTKTPFFLGLNGPQGSGKTTLAAALSWVLEHQDGRRCAVLSLDDLYKTRAERAVMAATIHPLVITRGVPGTHDVHLGLRVFDQLMAATAHSETPLPQFDKHRDDRSPAKDWPRFKGRPDIVIFEGWFVGAYPENLSALDSPVNDLEALEDSKGDWRRYANDALARDYPPLFERLNALIVLVIPAFDKVFEWRLLQEQKLKDMALQDPRGVMDVGAMNRFIQHFERLTRHTQRTLKESADIILELDTQHRITQTSLNRLNEGNPSR